MQLYEVTLNKSEKINIKYRAWFIRGNEIYADEELHRHIRDKHFPDMSDEDMLSIGFIKIGKLNGEFCVYMKDWTDNGVDTVTSFFEQLKNPGIENVVIYFGSQMNRRKTTIKDIKNGTLYRKLFESIYLKSNN